MSRRLGPLLPLLLVGLLLLVRETQVRAADRLARGEERAVSVLHALADAAREADDAAPRLAPLLHAASTLTPLQVDPALAGEVDYARDRSYVYGLARLLRRDDASGELRGDWVLRAWPLDFGHTGDAEFQLASDGVLWEGQNLRGRSGTETGFPPPFPEPEVGDRPAHWWERPRSDQR